MQTLDLLVGTVAVVLGLAIAGGAAIDGAWLMSLAKPRMLADALGKPAARVVLGLVGLACAALGVAIAAGWRVNWG
ncbi:MAG: hypothetical protein MUF06_16625 [Pirellulaceae bacterium]|jgi:hypothetical protein|nr:hypothetical protein [Pirellulaceae bacterium]